MSGYKPARIDVFSSLRGECTELPTRPIPKPHAAFTAAGIAGSISTLDVERAGLPLKAGAETVLMSNLLVWPTSNGEQPVSVSVGERTRGGTHRAEANRLSGRADAHAQGAQGGTQQRPEQRPQCPDTHPLQPQGPVEPTPSVPQPERPAVVKPVWEVDSFRWPAPCDALIDQEGDYFGHAGQKLSEASQRGLKTLAVTASGQGEGCTTLAICLARAATAAGARVVLIDTDVRSPQLSAQLGLDFAHGWQDVLREGIPWAEAAVNSLGDELTLLPAAAPNRPVQGQLADPGFPQLVRQVSTHFDLLILDCGQFDRQLAVLLGSGATCAASAAIVVRDLRRTSEESTVAVATRLKAMGIQAVGVAENFLAQRRGFAAA